MCFAFTALAFVQFGRTLCRFQWAVWHSLSQYTAILQPVQGLQQTYWHRHPSQNVQWGSQ